MKKDFDFEELHEIVYQLTKGIKKYDSYKADSAYDTIGFGFNLNDQCSAIKMSISFDTWAKEYGSHISSPIISSLGKAFEFYFIKYLNDNITDILTQIMHYIKKDMTEKAKARIDELNREISYIKQTFLSENLELNKKNDSKEEK